MSANLMAKKNYDLAQITRLLLEMRENCVPKDGNLYDDPKRKEKYDALNAAIDLINNPSMQMRWIRAKYALPGDPNEFVLVLANAKYGEYKTLIDAYELATYSEEEGWILEAWPQMENVEVAYWMPLPPMP